MIARKAFLFAAAIAAVAAAAGVFVVSLAYALFALARDAVGPAGAAAIVAGAAALLFLIVGLLLAMKAGAKAKEPSVAEKALAFARERPLIALAAALGGGFLALRNPSALMAVGLAFLEGRQEKKRR